MTRRIGGEGFIDVLDEVMEEHTDKDHQKVLVKKSQKNLKKKLKQNL